jgi:hypothetical protein
VFVLWGGGTSQANQAPNTSVPTDQSELVAALRDQIRDLREQLGQANERDRENRRIIAALTSRIPAIEFPPTGALRTALRGHGAAGKGRASAGPTEGSGGPQGASERRWWEFWR